MKQPSIKCLSRLLFKKELGFETVKDPRKKRGKNIPAIEHVLTFVIMALSCLRRNFRHMEEFCQDLPKVVHKKIGWKRTQISDTTIYTLLRNTDPEGMREALFTQLRQDIDSKRIQNDLMPHGIASYDGKNCGAGQQEAPPLCRSTFAGADCRPIWTLPILRCCLTSCSSWPVIDQEIMDHRQGEPTVFKPMFERDATQFYKLFRYVTTDSGITSRENAQLVLDYQKHYVFALKENHRWLYKWVIWLLKSTPLACESRERYQGKWVHRVFYRIPAPFGLRYPGLQQLWKIVRTTTEDNGNEIVEERYYLTSIPWEELKPEQMMTMIRLHWAIEDGANWTMDVIFKEDTHLPCQQGFGPAMLSWLTVMAYNIVSLLRRRLSSGLRYAMSWHRVTEKLYQGFLNLGADFMITEGALGNV